MKYDFSKQTKARKIMIIATCCLAVILSAFSSITVYADGSYDFVTIYDMPSTATDFSQYNIKCNSSSMDNYAYMVSGSHFNAPSSSFESTFDPYNDQTCYVCSIESIQWAYLYCIPQDSIVIGNENGFRVCVPNDYFTNSNASRLYFKASWWGTDENFISVSNGIFNRDYVMTIDNVEYRYYQSSDYLVSANCKVIYAEDLSSPTQEELETNVNDNYSGTGSGQTAENNMYFKNFDISYSVSNMYQGNIVCYGTLTDYQKEHLDEFTLCYNITFDESVTCNWVSGKKYKVSETYVYQESLSDFYYNDSSTTFKLQDVEKACDFDSELAIYDGIQSAYNWYARDVYEFNYALSTGGNQGLENGGIAPNTLNIADIIWSKATCNTTCFIVKSSTSPSDILSNSNLRSNSFSESYNFLKGSQSNQSDGITTNNNPYSPNETSDVETQEEVEINKELGGTTSKDIPSSSSGSGSGTGTSVVTGDNNIVINNNPTNNVNGGSGGSGNTSDSSLLGSFSITATILNWIINGKDSGVEALEDASGVTGWLDIVNSTYTFIPTSFWTLLVTCFSVCLGIVVVAFIISIVIKFVT